MPVAIVRSAATESTHAQANSRESSIRRPDTSGTDKTSATVFFFIVASSYPADIPGIPVELKAKFVPRASATSDQKRRQQEECVRLHNLFRNFALLPCDRVHSSAYLLSAKLPGWRDWIFCLPASAFWFWQQSPISTGLLATSSAGSTRCGVPLSVDRCDTRGRRPRLSIRKLRGSRAFSSRVLRQTRPFGRTIGNRIVFQSAARGTPLASMRQSSNANRYSCVIDV